MLEKERQFYGANHSRWLQIYANRVVLVKDHELIGVFDTDEEALAVGTRRFGSEPFLIQRVTPEPCELEDDYRRLFGSGGSPKADDPFWLEQPTPLKIVDSYATPGSVFATSDQKRRLSK